METTGITSSTRCIRCGKEIAITRQFMSEVGYVYRTENLKCRFIDKWGFPRNFCKGCMERS